MRRLDGWERLGVVVSLAFIGGMGWSFLNDPAYYIRNPEDVLVGFWGIAGYWTIHFTIRWKFRDSKGNKFRASFW